MTARPRTRPRKQATQARAKETVDAILVATARILVKEGYDHASTNRIAELAGVSIGSLYQYFPSKEALVSALLEEHIEKMTTIVNEALARVASAPLEVAARELVRTMIQAHSVDPKLHKVLVEQTPRVGRLERIYEIERQVMTLVRGYLEANARDIRAVDLDIAAFVAVSAVEALTHAAVLMHSDLIAGDRRELVIDEITALIVRYLRKDPS